MVGQQPGWAIEADALIDELRHELGWLPYDPTPARLYRSDDLYTGLGTGGFAGCVDQQIYARARKSGGGSISPVESLAQRLHDHGITVALDEFRAGRRLVGVMGGHALARGSGGYRQAVALGRALALAGYCVTTGGGPGAMEAANLGAASSAIDEPGVDELMARLAEAPTFGGDADNFSIVGLRVAHELASVTEPVPNLSVPTWFYGHEPSNPFATHIAKYFSNSEREDGLLAIATAGIVFVRGGPGTLQEVFQDAAQNAYRTFGPPSPMVFLDPPDDADWWEGSGVLTALDRAFHDLDGNHRPGRDLVANVDSVEAVLDRLDVASVFVPADFRVPLTLHRSEFRLEPLGPEHNERDHDAWMSSIEHIRATPGFEGHDWPVSMDLEANRADLVGHARDFDARSGFTFSVLDGDDVVGCVYIYPSRRPGFDAEIRSWVRVSRAELDGLLWQAMSDWLASAWPFRNVFYAPRS